MNWLVMLPMVVAMVKASGYDIDPEVYNDLLVQDLYKRLALIDEPELRAPVMPDYYYEGSEDYQMPKDAWMENSVESRGNADPRDQEFIEHGPQGDGFQYISGGAGEGVQHLMPEGSQDNTQEVKTDEHLPFYCHPPNPCPKGFTSEDGCQDFVDDTAEFQRKWIWKMQQEGMCACDEEHMFHCPKEDEPMGAEKDMNEKNDLDEVLGMFAQKPKENNPFVGGSKRGTLVAKKSPIVKRSIDDIDGALEKMRMAQKKDHNPYLGGYKLSRAAKKGLGYN